MLLNSTNYLALVIQISLLSPPSVSLVHKGGLGVSESSQPLTLGASGSLEIFVE